MDDAEETGQGSDPLLALGISHKTAPVALRERLALPDGRAVGVLADLVAHPAIDEAVAVSTCNRAELYLTVTDPVEAESAALGALARQAGIRPTELLGSLYSMHGQEAVRHLFEVAAGLDSMIIGEAEIQGQVKRAYELALVEGATGPLTNRLFRDALGAGKRVRSETGIGRSRISVPSVAAGLARDVLGPLESRSALVIGAGETGELTARAFSELGVRTMFVANRRHDRAIGLAQRFGGAAVRFDDLPAELMRTDIVVTATDAPHQIVGREELELVAGQRDGRQLLMIDIAVPRDIDPSVRELGGITLYDMDDLQREVARNLSGREAETERVRAIVEQELERFSGWLASLEAVPTIAALSARGEAIATQVLRENESRWELLSDADRERLGVMARAVVRRLLHEPTTRLKQTTDPRNSYARVQALRELFGLEPDAEATIAQASSEDPGAAVTSLESRRRRQRSG